MAKGQLQKRVMAVLRAVALFGGTICVLLAITPRNLNPVHRLLDAYAAVPPERPCFPTKLDITPDNLAAVKAMMHVLQQTLPLRPAN